MTHRIYASDRGYGYEIIDGGGAVVSRQDFAPGAEGFQPMTEDEAGDYARAVIAVMETPPSPSALPEPEPPVDEVRQQITDVQHELAALRETVAELMQSR